MYKKEAYFCKIIENFNSDNYALNTVSPMSISEQIKLNLLSKNPVDVIDHYIKQKADLSTIVYNVLQYGTPDPYTAMVNNSTLQGRDIKFDPIEANRTLYFNYGFAKFERKDLIVSIPSSDNNFPLPSST